MSANQQPVEYLEFAKAMALEAGKIMKHYFLADDIGTKIKGGDRTPVTVADTEINSLVIKRVEDVFPGHGVRGEEESVHNGREWMWICDPVDGTMPYSLGLPISTFSLALTRNGVPQLGVVYDPFIDRLYWAQLGEGAFMNDEPIHVSGVALKDSYVGLDQWATGNVKHSDLLIPMTNIRDALLDCGVKPLTLASAIITGCLIAQGEIVAEIFACTKPEDIAALKVIVEEAGGKVTDIEGNDQRYDRSINGAIVSNGIVHNEILKLVAQCVS